MYTYRMARSIKQFLNSTTLKLIFVQKQNIDVIVTEFYHYAKDNSTKFNFSLSISITEESSDGRLILAYNQSWNLTFIVISSGA